MDLDFSISRCASPQRSALYLSPRRGMSTFGQTKPIAQQVILSAGFTYRDALVDGLDLRLSVHDIVSSRQQLVVPYYDSGRAEMPYKGREISLGLGYRL